MRGRPHISAFFLIFFFCLLGSFGNSQSLPVRTLRLKVVIDEECQQSYQIDSIIKQQIGIAAQRFEKRFGIRFETEKISHWKSDDSRDSMFALLDDLRSKIPEDNFEVVLGITAQNLTDTDYVGAAAYLNSYILMQSPVRDSMWSSILEHEFAHLFGAVDLNEPGSIMDKQEIGVEYNDFLDRIIRLNHDRSFNPYVFPLPENKWDSAIKIYTRRKRLNLDEEDLNILLALIHLQKEDYPAMEIECYEILEKNPDFPEAHNLLGIALRRQGHIDKAISEYKKALDIQPYKPEIFYNMGIAYMKKYQYKEAIRNYEEAIRLHPRFARAYGNLGFVYLQQEKTKMAIEECQKALAIYPRLTEALSTLGAALILEGSYDEAEKVSQRALDIDPEMSGPHCNLGSILLHNGELDAAINSFKQAVALDSTNAEAFYNLGRAYFLRKSFDDAILAFQNAINLNQNYDKAYANLAAIFLIKHRFKDALAASQKSLILNPKNTVAELNLARAHFSLGNVYFEKEMYAESIQHYLKGLEIHSDFAQAYNNLSVIYYYQGEYEKAWDYLKQAEKLGVTVHPEFKKALLAKLKNFFDICI